MPFMGMHWPELLALLGVAMLLFGAKRLPELGASVGKTITEFRKSMREGKDSASVTTNLPEPQPSSVATSEPRAE